MRTEREMLNLILHKAKTEKQIRAVILNGSRINSNVRPDPFQDFDIVYVVSELCPFIADHSWIEYFGERLIMQMPDEMQLYHDDQQDKHRFAYLMQFQDGNRIDLTLIPTDHLPETFDSLSKVLLDKDGLLPNLPEPNESDYHISKPTAHELASCANEYWWVSTYVAKGLWRQQLPYAKTMMEGPVRNMLERMMTWYIGVSEGLEVNIGAAGKNFESLLSSGIWKKYVETYADGTYESMWHSLLVMCELFELFGIAVAEKYGYEKPTNGKVKAYLWKVRNNSV